MNRDEVNTAFEILLEELELVTNDLNEAGAEAFRAADYDKARQALEDTSRLAAFHARVKALQREWSDLAKSGVRLGEPQKRRADNQRLERGLRTPEEAFRRPILETLAELGGRAKVGEVLERIGTRMKSLLTPYDHESLRSDPDIVRWRNTAQWCRLALVQEGLMRRDSPRGIWEISEAGRKWLEGDIAGQS